MGASEHFGLEGAREHIKTALEFLGKKLEPDYRNSIKESISSLESVVKQISGENSRGLGGTIKALPQHAEIHSELISAFNSLYGYSSKADGIRHAILEQPGIDSRKDKNQ